MIPVKNVYYMLSYAFRSLKSKGYKKLETEDFENAGDLMAAILTKAIVYEIKKGLDRDYIPKDEMLATVRGRINISESIKNQSMLRKKLNCTYDDFSIDTPLNQILKSTANLLIKSDISKKRKKELRKIMVYFSEVSYVSLSSVNWNIYYNRNNQSYQMLMSICYLIYKSMIEANEVGHTRLMEYVDDQSMHKLYEKFILEYYKRHFPSLKIKAAQIPWSLDNDYNFMLPLMQTDVYIESVDRILIIDAKYYATNVQEKNGTIKNISSNLYQIFTYVKNCSYNFEEENKKVSGMLLYGKTDKSIQPNNDYMMHGNHIAVRTLDMNQNFSKISQDMDSIIYEFFGEVEKFL